MITRAQIRRQLRKNGGIMNAVPRQGYFLGKLVRGVKKGVDKVLDVGSQVIKSPIGKAALIGLGGAGLMGYGPMSGLGGLGARISPFLFGTAGGTSAMTPGILGKLGLTGGGGAMGLTGLGKLAGGAGLLTYFMSKGKTEEEAKELIQDVKRGEGLGLDLIQADMKKYRSGALSGSQAYDKGYRFLTPRNYMQAATGGRVGYQDGTPAVDPRMQLSQAENIQRNNLQREMNERARTRGGSNLSGLGGLELRDRFVNQTGPSGQQMYGINARPYNMNTPTTPINEANIYGSYLNQGLSPAQIKAISYADTMQSVYGDTMMGPLPMAGDPYNPLSIDKFFTTPEDQFAQYQEGLRRSMMRGARDIYYDPDKTYDAGNYQSGKGIYTFRDPEPTRGMIIDGKEYFSEQEAIDDMGVDRYTQVMAKGGRVGLANGSEGVEQMYLSDEAGVIPKKGNKGITKEDRNLTKEDFDSDKNYKRYIRQQNKKASGGRIGKYGGGVTAAMPRIPTGMPRVNAGGISELDYRQEGGFVPMGVKEKADDVPAMLSKNEFVMTADAVKGAGGGNVEKGAQKMYNTMKQLEGRIA